MATVTCKIKDYIQPFERALAIAELQALTGGEVEPIDGQISNAINFRVETRKSLKLLASSLAYWEAVKVKSDFLTQQVKLEASSIVARNGVALLDIPDSISGLVDEKVPSKRCLRYASHGLHEYRGKFFPQLVRSLINMAGVPTNGTIVDPMCGSGTTIVESILAGRRGYGIDMNPLSVFLCDVKCQVLTIEPGLLISAYEKLQSSLNGGGICRLDKGRFSTFEADDQEYLLRWFAKNVLEELDRISAEISRVRRVSIRKFYELCLSNILREVSWQKLEDLRVRKEIKAFNDGYVINRFLDEVHKSTKSIVAFNSLYQQDTLGTYEVIEGDARKTNVHLRDLEGRVDAVITSPPYATALPYLDTDRLSLIYLGLLSRPEHRRRDALMIGNREITSKNKAAYWEYYRENRELLPNPTRNMIEKIDYLNRNSEAGFRRKNLSSLLTKYFFDMRSVLERQCCLLHDDATLFMVIGNNTTTAGGELIQINTAENLAAIAETVGLCIESALSMDMLASRDIFRHNAMPSEQILVMKKN